MLDKADRVHKPSKDETRDERGSDAAPTPAPSRADAISNATQRVQAQVTDVTLIEEKGKLTRVDVQVLLPDGTHRPVPITRGGTKLLKDGKAAGVRQLKIGQHVVLSVRVATGDVVALSIVTEEENDQRERDEAEEKSGRGQPQSSVPGRDNRVPNEGRG